MEVEVLARAAGAIWVRCMGKEEFRWVWDRGQSREFPLCLFILISSPSSDSYLSATCAYQCGTRILSSMRTFDGGVYNEQ